MEQAPEHFRQAKGVLDKHLQDCSPYAASYRAATGRLEQSMSRYSSAWSAPETLIYNEAEILTVQLLAAGVCPKPNTRRILMETACRLLPYGCVSAEVSKYSEDGHCILLDTGTSDFFGNVACLLFAIFEQEFGHCDYGLDETSILNIVWGLALIYYDHGLQTKNEALVFPHFRYRQLRDIARPYAQVLSASARSFFLFHEFGHIVDGLPAMGLSIDAEIQADQFAFTAVREVAFARYTPEVTEFTILGCTLALQSLEFIETTFSGLEVQIGSHTRRFPPPHEAYPSATSRMQSLLSGFPTKQRAMLESHRVFQTMQKTLARCSSRIREGWRPSPEFWEIHEWKLQQAKKQRSNAPK